MYHGFFHQSNRQIQKDRQCNGRQKKGQTMQWPTEKRTDNAMADRKKGQTMQWPTEKRTDNAMADRKKNRQ
jgi:hypothetical protein